MKIRWSLSFIIALLLSVFVFAQQPNDEVGRKAAEKYFVTNSKPATVDNVLMIHLGRFTNSQAYDWGGVSPVHDGGTAVYGITYLFEQWHGFDAHLRVDFHEFNIQSERAAKMSLLPIWTFPRVDSNFPLYFGLGGGLGIFMQQLSGKSYLSFDYQLFMGARFLNIVPGFGAFLEVGMKNHLHILSTGQFNGTAVSAGAVFTF